MNNLTTLNKKYLSPVDLAVSSGVGAQCFV